VIVVVDTNIVFSGILSPNGAISDLLLNSSELFDFFAPTIIMDELDRHHSKLVGLSGYNEDEIDFLKLMILKKIELFDLDLVSKESWLKADELTKNIDVFDTPFIALCLELKSPLWTGDQKLKRGLEKMNIDWILGTEQIKMIRDK